MKSGIGCLLFLVGGVGGGFIVALSNHYQDRHKTFIGSDEARLIAVDFARQVCRDTRHVRPVDCTDFALVSSEEGRDGWNIQLRSHDGRRQSGVFVIRDGEPDFNHQVDLDDVHQ